MFLDLSFFHFYMVIQTLEYIYIYMCVCVYRSEDVYMYANSMYVCKVWKVLPAIKLVYAMLCNNTYIKHIYI